MKCCHGGVSNVLKFMALAEIYHKVVCVQSSSPNPAALDCQQPTLSCRSRNMNVLSYKLTSHGKLQSQEWQIIYPTRVDCLKFLQSLYMAGFYDSILSAVCHKQNEIKTVG